MKKKNILNGIYHSNHKIPTTRRELLGQGFVTASGIVMAPSILTSLGQRAYGADCGEAAAGVDRMTPVICIDCAGGANFAGSNAIVGTNESQLNTTGVDYGGLGVPNALDPNGAGMITDEIGLVMHSQSDLLEGIRRRTSAATRANMNGLVLCATSQDDDNGNPHNPMYWLRQSGLVGSLTSTIGTRGNESGGKSIAPASSVNPAFRPARVSNYGQAVALVDQGKLEQILPGSAEKILTATEKMSRSQLTAFLDKSMPEQIKTLVECGYIQSKDLLTKFTPESVNPNPGAATPDPAITAALAVNNPTQFTYGNNLDVEQTLSVAKLVIDGYAGAGTIEIGGCDYHNQGRQRQANKDFEIGETIGLSMEIAAQKGQDLIVYVFSDGAVRCGNAGAIENNGGNAGTGKPQFTGDDGSRGSSLMFVYRAAGRAELRTPGDNQIGSYTTDGRVDTRSQGTNIEGGNVEKLASAFLINYLAFEGLEANFEQVVGSNPLGPNMDSFIKLMAKK